MVRVLYTVGLLTLTSIGTDRFCISDLSGFLDAAL